MSLSILLLLPFAGSALRRAAAGQRAQSRGLAGGARRARRDPARGLAVPRDRRRQDRPARDRLAAVARAELRAADGRLRLALRDAGHRRSACWWCSTRATTCRRRIRCRASSRSCSPSWARCSGIVLSGNLIQLVFFWELTSLFSFLLIGYWHHTPTRARRRAHGADHHGRRRALPARRRADARPHRRQLRPRPRAGVRRPRSARTRSTCRRWS